jgi:hypothetical protein
MGYLPTYGEAYTELKLGLKMVDGIWTSPKVRKHLPRMDKLSAGEYYSNKFNTYWDTMFKDEFPIDRDREFIIKSITNNTLVYREFCYGGKL